MTGGHDLIFLACVYCVLLLYYDTIILVLFDTGEEWRAALVHSPKGPSPAITLYFIKQLVLQYYSLLGGFPQVVF